MDNLVTLLEKKQYKLVLDLTENTKDPEAIFARASALLSLQKSQDAMALLERNRSILWKHSPIKLMKANFELRFILNEYDEAYDDASYFSSLPYVSQEVEEYLHSLGKMIRFNERQSSMKYTYSESEVRQIIEEGKDVYEIISLLSSFDKAKISYFSSSLVLTLKNNESSLVKTYCLMLLIRIKYQEEISFNKNGQQYTLIPKEMKLPYEEENAIYISSSIQKEVKDPSLFNIARNLMNNFMFEIFPGEPFTSFSLETYIVSFVNLAHSYLKDSFDGGSLLEKYKVEAKDVKECASYINDVLSNSEKIKV